MIDRLDMCPPLIGGKRQCSFRYPSSNALVFHSPQARSQTASAAHPNLAVPWSVNTGSANQYVGMHSQSILEALASPATAVIAKAMLKPKHKVKGNTLMNPLEVKIEGMHCNGCASTIQALLSHEPGIKSAAVSFANSKATVLYDPNETDPAKVKAAIEKAGYRATGGEAATAT